jgi:hypothetical protein
MYTSDERWKMCLDNTCAYRWQRNWNIPSGMKMKSAKVQNSNNLSKTFQFDP